MVRWPGDLLCAARLAWDYRAGFLATAGFALPREPRVKLDRARTGSARQSTAGRNELDTGKPRPMFASEEEPAGYWLPGQRLISPVQAWPARPRPGRPGPDIAAVQPSARRFTYSVATGKAKLRLGLPPRSAAR
jgi:hypothetical protein